MLAIRPIPNMKLPSLMWMRIAPITCVQVTQFLGASRLGYVPCKDLAFETGFRRWSSLNTASNASTNEATSTAANAATDGTQTKGPKKPRKQRGFLPEALEVDRSPVYPAEFIGLTKAQILEDPEMKAFLPSSVDPASPDWTVKIETLEQRVGVAKYLTKKYTIPIPSNLFPAMKSIDDYASYFERAMEPLERRAPVRPEHLGEIPPNLKLDERTFQPLKRITKEGFILRLKMRNPKFGHLYHERLQRMIDLSWNDPEQLKKELEDPRNRFRFKDLFRMQTRLGLKLVPEKFKNPVSQDAAKQIPVSSKE